MTKGLRGVSTFTAFLILVPAAGAQLPPDLDNYQNRRSFFWAKVTEAGPAMTYVLSDALANVAIIDHCVTMGDVTPMGAMLTPDELAALYTPAGRADTKAKVVACLRQYDAAEIIANRKAAIEYCIQPSNLVSDPKGGLPFDNCMQQHDMLLTMCKQELEQRVEYSMRSFPGRPRTPQKCPGVQLYPKEAQAALSAPRGTVADLPAKVLAPPKVSTGFIAPPVPIPAGTAVAVTVTPKSIVVQTNGASDIIHARLDQPIEAGGKVLFAPGTLVYLKARIIGPGSRPNSLQIGVSTEWAKMADDRRVELRSQELVYTVMTGPPFFEVVPEQTKLTFTIKN